MTEISGLYFTLSILVSQLYDAGIVFVHVCVAVSLSVIFC